jgi:hypothetical protein
LQDDPLPGRGLHTLPQDPARTLVRPSFHCAIASDLCPSTDFPCHCHHLYEKKGERMVVVAGQPWRDVEDRSWSRCCHSLLPFAFSSSSSSPFCTVIVGIHKTVSPAHSCDAQRGVQFRLIMCRRGRETRAGKQGGIVELVASCSLTIRVCKYCLFAVPFQSMLHATWCLSNSSSSSRPAVWRCRACCAGGECA